MEAQNVIILKPGESMRDYKPKKPVKPVVKIVNPVAKQSEQLKKKQ